MYLELQGCLEEKKCLRGKENVTVDVDPARIMMVPLLISTKPRHAIEKYKKNIQLNFSKFLT